MTDPSASLHNGANTKAGRSLPSWISARESETKSHGKKAADEENDGTKTSKQAKESSPSKKPESSKKSSPSSSGPTNFSKLLEGVVFVLSGFVNPERSTLRSQALEMGAEYQQDWNSNCTLLVCAFANTPKFRQVEADCGTVVSKEWISECYNQRKLVDIEIYFMHAGKPWRKQNISNKSSQVADLESSLSRKSLTQIDRRSHAASPKVKQSGSSNPAKECFSPSKVKKWAIDDLNKTVSWLESQEEKVYIVYIGEHRGGKMSSEIEDDHHSYLQLAKNGSKLEAKASLVYSYKNIINGFSAWLTPHEAAKLSEMEEVVSVFKSRPRKYSLQTTRSWDFVNLLEREQHLNGSIKEEEELLQKANGGEDIIVGVLDSGVWPESQSFSDEGMGPVPPSWKGTCELGDDFEASNCNRKIIGARYYLKGYEAYYGPLNNTQDYRSPRDKDGHGTHTASTIGGRRVPDISLMGGFANGTATGGAPLSRLAIYKVCWPIPGQPKVEGNTCFDEDMIAAFDDAIADGVDVLSISIRPFSLAPYEKDGIAIGALHAVKRNVVVVCSAGNNGPGPSTVRNVAPWILTVGASSIDRVFSSPVLLGNGQKIEGQTVTPFKLDKMYPLVYAGNSEIPGTTTNDTTGLCLHGTLSPALVEGKIVLCLSGYSFNVEKGLEVKGAGGIGIVLQNPVNGIGISVDDHVLPGTAVFSNDSVTILDYISASNNSAAMLIPPETVLGSRPAPFMAAFSSMGPNGLQPNILKPDITAPGLNILAAWSEASSPTKLPEDDRVVKYNIDSGTSMSCPHVAAAAALIKAIHPDWSSAAIRSALMTTAETNNNVYAPITDAMGNPATPFHYGSGHFQPAHAVDPGLVYDATYDDYLVFLCNTSATKFDPSFQCPERIPSPSDLNYPSLAIAGLQGTVTVNRTVTHVGSTRSVYTSTFVPPTGYSVEISPLVLEFSYVGEKKSFTVTVNTESGSGKAGNEYSFGWYMWSDGTHRVRSPIVVCSA